MTVHIQSNEPRGALGYSWPAAGAVVPVADEDAPELLPIPGFSEVPADHHGRHEAAPDPAAPVTEPGPDASTDTGDESDDGDNADGTKKPARGARSKAVTE